MESGYLQFTFPQNYKSLNYESVPPLAVPVYSSINEEDTEFLESFDKDGNIVKLSAKEMPNVPVIIVGRSERVDEDGYMLVNERSVVLPKKMRTLHYAEAIKESRNNLKSAKLNQHIVTILSQEEFDKRKEGQEHLEKLDYDANLKSASDIQLTGYTNKPKEMYLTWSQYSDGTYTSNRYKIFRDDVEIYDQYYYRSKMDIAPEANSVYNYQIKYYCNDTYLGESNYLELHSSHRQSGGYEYINYIYVSHAMIVAVEGWWVSELEIKWAVYYAKEDGTADTLRTGGHTYDTDGSTTVIHNWDDVNIFQWNKESLAYTIRFWEDDNAWRTKTDEVYVGLVAVGIKATQNSTATKIAELIEDPVKKLITVLRDDDPMGQTTVYWWTHDNYSHPVNDGFEVVISHKINP